MDAFRGFKVGDYVIADKAEDDYWPETWVIVALDFNLIGRELVHVVDIATQYLISPRRVCFYPRELSYEDGSQPDS